MRIIIVCGSPIKTLQYYQKQDQDFIIGVDAGCIDLIKMGIDMDLAMGDFDHAFNLEEIKLHTKKFMPHSPIKDEIDLELVLKHLTEKKCTSDIFVYNALGGRLDHELVTIKLLKKYSNLNLTLISDTEFISYKTNSFFIKNPNKRFSLVPLDKVKLAIHSARYLLPLTELDIDTVYTTSNESTENTFIEIQEGGVIFIVEK